MKKPAKADSFEESLERLEAVVRDLESGQKGLEESLELFEKGVSLAKTLTTQLEEAKHRVEVLTKEHGTVTRRAMDEDARG